MDYTGTHKIASLASIFIPSPKKVKNGKGLQIEALINVFIVVYDSEGNLTENLSKELKILYDWRGMPIEFIQTQQPTGSSDNSLFRLTMAYDGSGRRISKTRWVKKVGSQDWELIRRCLNGVQEFEFKSPYAR